MLVGAVRVQMRIEDEYTEDSVVVTQHDLGNPYTTAEPPRMLCVL